MVKFLKGETEVFEKKLRVLCCLDFKQEKGLRNPVAGLVNGIRVLWIAFVCDLFRVVEQNVADADKC